MDGGLEFPAPSMMPMPGIGVQEVRAPGRPSSDPAKRAANDARYAKTQELLDSMPDSVKEWKFAIYEARLGSDTKADHKPLGRIAASRYVDEGLKDEGAMSSYLEGKYGPGKYLIEPLDEHNRRVERAPTYCVYAGNEDDMFDDDEDDLPRRSRRRRRYAADDLDDDEFDLRSSRANIGDLVTTLARRQGADNAAAAQGSTSLATAMLLSQKEGESSRAQLELKREEMAEQRRREEREERRRDEEKAETRRQEMHAAEIRRQEERAKEEREERRRDDEKAEQRRREEREAAAKSEQVAREALAQRIEAENRRSETQMKVIFAAIPVIEKLFNKPVPEDKMGQVLISQLTQRREPDPMVMMILKDSLDKRGSGSEAMSAVVDGIMQANRAQMQISSEFNATMLKRVMDMALTTPGTDQPMIEQIAKLVDAAGGFVKNVFPTPPPQQQQPVMQPQRRPLPHNRAAALPAPPQRPGQAAQPAAASAAQPVQGGQPGQPAQVKTWEEMSPEEQAAQQAQMPRGTLAVLICLKALQQKTYTTPAEQQELNMYLLHEMPVELRVAVITKDESSIFAICKPHVEQVPELKQWLDSLQALNWVREYTAQLIPHIISLRGPEEVQKQELAQAIAQAEAQLAAQAQAQAAPAATQPPVPGQPPTEIAPDATPVPAATDAAPAAVPPAPLPGPGSVTVEAPATSRASAVSHLDDPDTP